VRGLAGAACLLLLACTLPAPDLARCCARCRVPAELTDLMLLVYRFLFLLAETARSIGRSQAARLGYGDLRRSVRSTATLLSALFARSLDRAGRLETGLAGRGFSGSARMLRIGGPLSAGRVAAVLAVLAVPVAAAALWRAAP
jgi:cobalt/nickel transport system permease protein